MKPFEKYEHFLEIGTPNCNRSKVFQFLKLLIAGRKDIKCEIEVEFDIGHYFYQKKKSLK